MQVVDLSAARDLPGRLLSLSREGSARVWDVVPGTCLMEVSTKAHTAVSAVGGGAYLCYSCTANT